MVRRPNSRSSSQSMMRDLAVATSSPFRLIVSLAELMAAPSPT
jgi:hypothetical protein